MTATFAFLLAGLLATGGPVSDTAHLPRSVPFTLIDHRVFVPVEIDGRGPYSFIVDTGSAGETVNARLAAEMHPTPVGEGSTDGGGEKKATYAKVHLDALRFKTLAFGAMNVWRERARCFPARLS